MKCVITYIYCSHSLVYTCVAGFDNNKIGLNARFVAWHATILIHGYYFQVVPRAQISNIYILWSAYISSVAKLVYTSVNATALPFKVKVSVL